MRARAEFDTLSQNKTLEPTGGPPAAFREGPSGRKAAGGCDPAGMAAHHLAGSFRPHSSYLRLNYYPVCPLPEPLPVSTIRPLGSAKLTGELLA